MNLASLDLNLLVVFDAIMSERNITRAGQRIGMTQPAMSNALKRLRLTLKDDLFVRGPEGMRPTQRALEIAGPVREALVRVEKALDPVCFHPESTTRIFRIGLLECSAALFLAPLTERLRQLAPHAKLECYPLTPVNIRELLEDKGVDCIVGPWDVASSSFAEDHAYNDRLVVSMRRGHPLTQGDLTVDAFCSADHILTTLTGDTQGPINEALQKMGFTRTIAVTVNHFLIGLQLAGSSDLLLVAPKSLLRMYGHTFGLVTRELPMPLRLKSMRIIWHARLGEHPAQQWFREQVKTVARGACQGLEALPDTALAPEVPVAVGA